MEGYTTEQLTMLELEDAHMMMKQIQISGTKRRKMLKQKEYYFKFRLALRKVSVEEKRSSHQADPQLN